MSPVGESALIGLALLSRLRAMGVKLDMLPEIRGKPRRPDNQQLTPQRHHVFAQQWIGPVVR